MKKLLVLAGAVILAGAAFAIWWSGDRSEWSTDSEAALAAYQRGRQAQMKFYASEAAAAYEEALAHDPEFVAARIGLLETARLDRERREQLREELRRTDRSHLNDRERFLIDVMTSEYEPAERRQAVLRYLADHPRDPWALMLAAGDAWLRQDWEQAERHYRQLLQVDPNFVLARNNLGYIFMAQGRFDAAEEQFRTYRYAAPDQANPHDSLGELYILIGRYEEARTELEAALATRPDFCASYQNLFRLAILDRRPEELEPVARRIAENCEPEMAKNFACLSVIGHSFLGGDPNAPWLDERCREQLEEEDVLVHLVALRAGRLDQARAVEERLAAKLAKMEDSAVAGDRAARGVLLLLEAQRLLAEGRPSEAIPKLREMDATTPWWASGGASVLRLVARLSLAEALEQVGEPAAAEQVRESLRAVNPEFERDWAGHFPPRPQAGG